MGLLKVPLLFFLSGVINIYVLCFLLVLKFKVSRKNCLEGEMLKLPLILIKIDILQGLFYLN